MSKSNKSAPVPVQVPVATPVVAKKNRKEVLTAVFPTLAEAMRVAASRPKSPNKVFTVSFNDKDYFVIAHNRHRAMGAVAAVLGAKVKVHKKEKPVDVDALVATLTPQQLEALKKLIS